MLIDLHVHTNASEGFDTELTEAVERCRERGIGAILVAECDVAPNVEEVARVSKEQDFPIFVGMDVDCADGRVIAVPVDPSDQRFVDQSWRGDDDDTTVRQVIDALSEMDGVVIAAHPYLDDGGPYLGDRIYDVEGLVAVEVVCGVKRHISNDLALEAAAGMGLPTVGGSDTGPEGQRLGWYATAFAEDIATQEELVDALNNGMFWAVDIREAKPGEGGQQRKRRRRRRSDDDD